MRKEKLNELALFAGAGGGILGSMLLGWETLCAVEIDPYCARRLMQRQNEGHIPPFPIWDDVCSFNGRHWEGIIDVVSGGFPCQDISSAGKRAGIDGKRSGLWNEFARIIGEVKPTYVLIENSQHLRTNGLVRVLKDLASMGYDARWCVLGAYHVRAPHLRKRMWILAYANNDWERISTEHEKTQISQKFAGFFGKEQDIANEREWWPIDSIAGMDAGVANRVDRIRATGNGQVSSLVSMVWGILTREAR